MNIKISENYVSSKEPEWNYPGFPGDLPAPAGRKVQLLTIGGTSTQGPWPKDGFGMLAWAPLIQRDKTKEAYLKEQQHGRTR